MNDLSTFTYEFCVNQAKFVTAVNIEAFLLG
jgi:hypothetical protein